VLERVASVSRRRCSSARGIPDDICFTLGWK
jgi:hypothetical protein